MMVEPAAFFLNQETLQDNHFQKEKEISQEQCRGEFLGFVATLQELGIEVWHMSNPDPAAPDAVFPNNWFSTHGIEECVEPTLVLYPMRWPSRRVERRPEFISKLKEKYTHVIDLTYLELQENGNLALESTGALVFDKLSHTVYMAISERASPIALNILLEELNKVAHQPWSSVVFHAQDAQGRQIYHTNVLLGLTPTTAVVNLSAIPSPTERESLVSSLSAHHRIVDITHLQMGQMCGNLLTLYAPRLAREVIIMSESCRPAQLPLDREIIYISIDGIETVGGGSARCMLGELF
jgi:hypothetical protein